MAQGFGLLTGRLGFKSHHYQAVPVGPLGITLNPVCSRGTLTPIRTERDVRAVIIEASFINLGVHYHQDPRKTAHNKNNSLKPNILANLIQRVDRKRPH